LVKKGVLQVSIEFETSKLEDVLNDSGSKLLVDPKARKIIIVEHPLLPLCVKNMFAKVLFQNLQVRAVIP
jgi:actin-related protein 10